MNPQLKQARSSKPANGSMSSRLNKVFIFQGGKVQWSVDDLIADCHQPCIVGNDLNVFIDNIIATAHAGDTIVVMSNGAFGDIHEKLLNKL